MFYVSHVEKSSNFTLCIVTVLRDSCTNYHNDRQYWAEISSLVWHVYCLNTAYSLEICYHYETNIKYNCCVMFTEHHMIQFNLHCLITKNWRPFYTYSTVYSKLWNWTVPKYKLFIIQSTINNSRYHPNTHQNILLP